MIHSSMEHSPEMSTDSRIVLANICPIRSTVALRKEWYVKTVRVHRFTQTSHRACIVSDGGTDVNFVVNGGQENVGLRAILVVINQGLLSLICCRPLNEIVKELVAEIASGVGLSEGPFRH